MVSADMQNKPRILLTGSSGFVGSALAAALLREGESLVCPVRRSAPADNERICYPVTGDFTTATDWRPYLDADGIVIHCAARVHVMNDTASDPLAAFRNINVDATLHLARQAAACGVRQFVFLSSVKVNGEQTATGQRFTENDASQAHDPYGISKLEAEQALLTLGKETGMAITIIRPPLVYGPGVKANFASMMRWVKKGIPLPFGTIHNQRSLVYVGNLVSLISACLRHPQAAQQIFLVSDGQDLSTSELLRHCAQALGVPSRLLPCPPQWIQMAARLAGKPGVAARLCASLQVDISKARSLLGWEPPYSVEQGLSATAASFR
jgi:nucleoside-diphosphate-sugar epimerase